MSDDVNEMLVAAVKKFFDGGYDGETWHYEQEDENIFVGKMSGFGGKIDNFEFRVIVGQNVVTCCHTSSLQVPEELRPGVAEFITRANYGLIRGNFEMDFNDGELRYKTTISRQDLLSDDASALENMKLLMILGPSMWKRYGDNLAAFLFGFTANASIKELVEACE